LSAVLYGCETWFFTLREEYRLRVCDSGVLREVFGRKRKEVMEEDWRAFYNYNNNYN
jgi:hypothetical protein